MNPSFLGDLGWFLFRVTFGLGMAAFHGYAKVFGGKLPGFAVGVANLGFPLPHFFAWCAALSEFAGGLLIAVGLATRGAALFVSGTMVVALYSHLSRGDPLARAELALLYLAAMVAILFIGGGRLSLDRSLRLRFPIQSRQSP